LELMVSDHAAQVSNALRTDPSTHPFLRAKGANESVVVDHDYFRMVARLFLVVCVLLRGSTNDSLVHTYDCGEDVPAVNGVTPGTRSFKLSGGTRCR